MSEADWKELLYEQKRTNELLEDIAEGIEHIVHMEALHSIQLLGIANDWNIDCGEEGWANLKASMGGWQRPSKREKGEG